MTLKYIVQLSRKHLLISHGEIRLSIVYPVAKLETPAPLKKLLQIMVLELVADRWEV